jgi:peptide chain release factor subunit 1
LHTSRALRNPSYAGWHGLVERRVRNRPDEFFKLHFREVAAALDRLFRANRYDILAVGGHEHELPVFVDFLPRWLRERGAGRCLWDASVSTVRALRSIQHLRAETKLHEQPTAAWLRFALPPEPSSTSGGQG